MSDTTPPEVAGPPAVSAGGSEKPSKRAGATGGSVAYKKNPRYWQHDEVVIGEYRFVGAEPVDIPASDVDLVTAAKGPDNHQWVVVA